MTNTRDVLLFGLLAIVWGSGFTAIEIGLDSLPPLLFAAFRFDAAALVFFALVVASRARWWPRNRDDVWLVLTTGILLIGVHFALLFLGQEYVSSSVAAIVLSFAPIVTPAIALAVLPAHRVRATDVLGLSIGFVGVVAIAAAGGSLGGRLAGVALLLGAAIVFALGSVLTQRFSRTLPLVSLQAWSMLVGAGILHAASLAHPMETLSTVDWNGSALAAIAYLGVVSTVGGFLLYFSLLERVGPTNASLVSYATPVVAAVFGAALLGEAITAAMVVGFGLIAVGFALCQIRPLWRLVRGRSARRRRPATGTVRVRGNEYVLEDVPAERSRVGTGQGYGPSSGPGTDRSGSSHPVADD
ncbi:DMT family transporter [Natronococcus occultus]|uniref:DMT(Drug/metabolite transporter) superfamily permease n=1 Tax=Natronococcus occultus SP4 TaxID=694430 RepID=L0JY72_9EURY|nr:DMT family transporter [Natronococcus occultus]AGB37250.1 DMT(drug/metabolite transporter) superfamily permease [Natronococcus occultus SP4]